MWFYFDDTKTMVTYISPERRILCPVDSEVFVAWLTENDEPEIYVEEQYFASLEENK